MIGDEVRDARATLGQMWNFGRPLFCSELGRVVRLMGRDPRNTVKAWGDRGAIGGPASAAIQTRLNGALPPDGFLGMKGSRA